MSAENQYDKKVSEQDILKAFDNADTPVLTANDLADMLPLTRQGANYRLNQMHDKGLVGKKKTGSRAVVWWSTVAPRLSEETKRSIEESEGELERGETIGMGEMKERLGIAPEVETELVEETDDSESDGDC